MIFLPKLNFVKKLKSQEKNKSFGGGDLGIAVGAF